MHHPTYSESRMREIRPSGLMQGPELSTVHSAANSCLLYLARAQTGPLAARACD